MSPECLEGSPTNTWWQEWRQSGASKQHAEAVLEQHADYDGIAVVWGIGHSKQTAEDCAEACRTYEPRLHNGGQTTFEVMQNCQALQPAQQTRTSMWLAASAPAMQCFHLTSCSAADTFSRLPCTVFSWCSQQTCFEPDAHTHSFGDCWLKFTEGPLNPEVSIPWLLCCCLCHESCCAS